MSAMPYVQAFIFITYFLLFVKMPLFAPPTLVFAICITGYGSVETAGVKLKTCLHFALA